jgi:DEAD/DEAH box helicase domain-containing protein
MTDIQLASVTAWPTGVFADPMSVEGRAAWYSIAFWLRLAAGVELDVDPLELQAGFRTRSDGARPIGEAFLSDRLENGAGYCRELALVSRFQRLLRQADATPLSTSGPSGETLAG